MHFETTNIFLEERIQYQPPLPAILNHPGLLEIDLGQAFTPPEMIQSYFPQTWMQKMIHFKDGKKKSEITPLRVGVVFSGGQAPGGHNVIAGLFDGLKKVHKDGLLFGFIGGPEGILSHSFKEIDSAMLLSYRNCGGFDLIGSGRTKIEGPEQMERAFNSCKTLQLDGLVVIGGDDSNTNAAWLAEYFKSKNSPICVVGVPKTIDGDLKNDFIEISFGFDTACKIYSEMIGNICRDALSAKKYTHFIKLMGRSASHIALECALQTHPNIVLIGEEIAEKGWTLRELSESITKIIVQRESHQKNYSVILIPEGVIEFIPEMKQLIQELNKENSLDALTPQAKETFSFLPKEIGQQLLLDRDPHGNVQVSHIATEQLFIQLVQKQLQDSNVSFSPVGHFLGYEGRCGYPSNFDATYCNALGHTAVALICAKASGYMSILQNLHHAVNEWEPLGIPLTSMMGIEERKGKQKAVIKKALVDLQGEPFKALQKTRLSWALQDHYRFPGPIQFFGPDSICNAVNLTLHLESSV